MFNVYHYISLEISSEFSIKIWIIDLLELYYSIINIALFHLIASLVN